MITLSMGEKYKMLIIILSKDYPFVNHYIIRPVFQRVLSKENSGVNGLYDKLECGERQECQLR